MCNKTWSLEYTGSIFKLMKDSKRRVGGNYPIGGEIIAKVDEELLEAIKKDYNPDTQIKIGDCVSMNNGWTLD
jgi:hypothetical protein